MKNHESAYAYFFLSVADELLSCQTLKITLKNEVLTYHGQYQGTYEMSASINGKPSWKSQSNVIWYSSSFWRIGNDDGTGDIITSGLLLGANESGKWIYWHEKKFKDIDTNDFSIECIAKKGTNQH